MKKKIINFLANFLLSNYNYKKGSRVRLGYLYLDFLHVLEKEKMCFKNYKYRQFRYDLEALANLFGDDTNFIEKRVQTSLFVINLQEKIDNNITDLNLVPQEQSSV